MSKNTYGYLIDAWLDDLNKETISLFHHLNLYKELSKIISGNRHLRKMDSTLLRWMQSAFTVDLVIGISRICDKRSGTRSLTNFLEKLKTEGFWLSRERYIKLYNGSPISDFDFANIHFDKLAGHSKTYYPKSKIERDITLLTKKQPIKCITDFRNQYLAHIVEHKADAPKYRDLFKAFRIIEKLMKKYNLLIRAASMDTLTPTIQGNWQEVLTIPWIKYRARNPVIP